MQMRQKWHSLFLRRMRAPTKPWSQFDESTVRSIVSVMTNEELALGLQQPAGIGQRPRPMSTETVISSGGSRTGSTDADQSDDASASGVSVGGQQLSNVPSFLPSARHTSNRHKKSHSQYLHSPLFMVSVYSAGFPWLLRLKPDTLKVSRSPCGTFR